MGNSLTIEKVHAAYGAVRVIEEHTESFVVRDATGQVLFNDDPSRGSATNRLTRHEAGPMAMNFAKLPERLRRWGSNVNIIGVPPAV